MLGVGVKRRHEPFICGRGQDAGAEPSLEDPDAAAAAHKLLAAYLEARSRSAGPPPRRPAGAVIHGRKGRAAQPRRAADHGRVAARRRVRDDHDLIGTGSSRSSTTRDEAVASRRPRAHEDRGRGAAAYDPPVQLDGRMCSRTSRTHGTSRRRAGRHAARRGQPRTARLRRSEPFAWARGAAPMSFGAGIHYCLGAASLGRGQRGVRPAPRSVPGDRTRVGGERPQYRDSIVLHGLESLPVRVRSPQYGSRR